MNDAHLHLLVNHLPIFATFLAIPVVALVLWRPRDRALLAAAAVMLLASGLGAVAANRTGEAAEEAVEDLPGFSEELMHEHEEASEIATGLAVATALLGLGAMGWGLKREAGPPPAATGAVLVGLALTAAAMANTGSEGGVIRHDEIRDGD